MKNNQFWQYSQKIYNQSDVSSKLLALQGKFQIDVNMVLCCCWLAEQGYILSIKHAQQLVDSCKTWRLKCLLPTRAVRQFLNQQATQQLYSQIKNLELEMECWQQQHMFENISSMSLQHSTCDRQQTILINLQAYTQCLDSCEWKQIRRLYEELIISVMSSKVQ